MRDEAVGVEHALGLPGGPRGVDDAREVLRGRAHGALRRRARVRRGPARGRRPPVPGERT